MYGNTKVLDVHSHVSSPRGIAHALVHMLGSNTPRATSLMQFGQGLAAPFTNGMAISDEQFRESAARHVAVIDKRSIDVQVIGPRPFLMLGWMEDHLLPSWCREVNDMIQQQCLYYPDRFLGACTLPQNPAQPDAKHMLPELERCVGDYGFVATYISPDSTGRRDTPGVDDPFWYPLYEVCEDRGIAVIVHGTNTLDRRLRVIPNNYQVGFMIEHYIATQLYQHSDVFDRFPRLRVIVCHCGGGLNRFVKGDPHLSSRDTSENLFFDTNSPDIDFLTTAIRQRGVGQMCFGVEAPGSGAHPRPENGVPGDDLVPVITGFDWLTEDDKIQILNSNPQRVIPRLGQL
jgi:predicted TIM-barrel fold metal-dependent hydrolase